MFPDGLVLGFGLLYAPPPDGLLCTPAAFPVVVPVAGEPALVLPAAELPPAELPVLCANANVPDSANAVAKAIVVNFMCRSSSMVETG